MLSQVKKGDKVLFLITVRKNHFSNIGRSFLIAADVVSASKTRLTISHPQHKTKMEFYRASGERVGSNWREQVRIQPYAEELEQSEEFEAEIARINRLLTIGRRIERAGEAIQRSDVLCHELIKSEIDRLEISLVNIEELITSVSKQGNYPKVTR